MVAEEQWEASRSDGSNRALFHGPTNTALAFGAWGASQGCGADGGGAMKGGVQASPQHLPPDSVAVQPGSGTGEEGAMGHFCGICTFAKSALSHTALALR